MMDVGGQPLIVRTLEQAKAIPGIQTVVLATTNDDADQILLQIAEEQGVVPFAGSHSPMCWTDTTRQLHKRVQTP